MLKFQSFIVSSIFSGSVVAGVSICLLLGSISSSEATSVQPVKKVPNSPPEFSTKDDKFSLGVEKELKGNVLTNDVYSGKEPRKVRVVKNVERGQLTLKEDGSFIYKPEANFTGVVRFSYVVEYGKATSREAQVEITISPVKTEPTPQSNIAPKASDDSFSVSTCQNLDVSSKEGVLKNDASQAQVALKVSLVRKAKHGEVKLNPDGSFSYVPYTDFPGGKDDFTYVASDGKNDSNQATVTITVDPAKPVEPEIVSSQHPLILSRGLWKSTSPTSQPYAFKFNKQGRLIISYRYSSGTFTRDAQYKAAEKPGKCFAPMDISMDDGRVLKTIFEIRNDRQGKTLRIQLAGLSFGADRPTKITPEGVKEFRESYTD